MKFFLPFLIGLLSATLCEGQLLIPETERDFGLLRRADPHWIDVEVKNEGPKTEYIFRVEAPKNADIKFSSKEIPPGESAYIRIAYSPKKEGKFKEELLVYASAWESPGTVKIKGESTHAMSSMIPCPDFGSEPSASSSSFHVSVKSEEDDGSIEDAEVLFYKDGEKVISMKTDDYGELTSELPYGRYFIAVRKGGLEVDTAMYVNAVNNHLVVLLGALADRVDRDESLAEVRTPEPEEAESQTDAEVDDNSTNKPEEVIYEDLPVDEFKTNNLVFLVDVSASMKQRGKLDLMKISIIELLKILRPTDRFTLISYSSDTEVLIETKSNLDRESCIKAIRELEAGGGTAGSRAIKKAGNMAQKNFVDGGNNQILLATDGAFNEEIDKAVRFTRRNKRKNIGMSVVGVKCGPFTQKQMTTLVKESGGNFVPIEHTSDANSGLVEEIKRSSRR